MAKIAIVSDAAYPWNVGGLETIERAEAEALAKSHDVHFFSLRWPGMQSNFLDRGITYHAFHSIGKDKFYRHGRRSIRESIIFSIGIMRIFLYKFDVIQANEFPILHLPILKVYCKLSGCRLIIDVHEVWDSTYWTTYLGRAAGLLAYHYATFALKMGDQYIANSSVTAKRLEDLGIEREMINLFSPVIDDNLFHKIGWVKQKHSIIFAGRLIKEKRLDRWLSIVKMVNKKIKVHGVIIGEGPEEKDIARAIKRLNLSKIVELRHFYKENEKYKLYQRIKEASLLLHMSEREGLGIVALESISLGTPVLLPEYSPIPYDIREMCNVADDGKLPDMAVRIIKGPKSSYIKNSQMLERFYISKTRKFYESLLQRMGIRN